MTELIEKRTKNVMYAGVGMLIFYSLVYIASLIFAVTDWNPTMFGCRGIFTTSGKFWLGFWCLFGAVLGGSLGQLILWCQSLWKEKFPGKGVQWFHQMFWLFLVPLFGLLFLAAILLVLAWKQSKLARNSAIAYAFLTAAGVACFGLFYNSSYPMLYCGIACIVISGYLLFLVTVPAILQMKYTRNLKRVCYVTLGMFVFSIVFAYAMMAYCDARSVQKKQELRELGICVTREDVLNAYFHGIAPDPEFSKLADKYNSRKGKAVSKIYFDPGMTFSTQITQLRKETNNSDPERILFSITNSEWMNQEEYRRTIVFDAVLSQLLTDNVALFQKLDKVFDPGKRDPVKYAMKIEESVASLQLPHFRMGRWIANSYFLRIGFAVKDGNRAETMRLFRSFGKVSRSAADEVFLTGAYSCFQIEKTRIDAFSAMLGAGFLTNSDIKEIEDDFADMENVLFATMKKMCLIEIPCALDWVDMMISYGVRSYFIPRSRLSLKNPFDARSYCSFRMEDVFIADAGKEYLAMTSTPDWNPIDKKSADALQSLSLTRLPSTRQILFLPVVHPIWISARSAFSENRMARTACKVERFRLANKRFPKTLSELPDNNLKSPFSGESFEFVSGNIPIYQSGRGRKISGHANGYRIFFRLKNKDGKKIICPDYVLTVTTPGSFRAVATEKILK